MGLTLFFCFTGKRFVRVDPAGSSSLHMGPFMKPFSTSFRVAAKRLMSTSLSPELCTDSKRTSRLRLETFLRSSQVTLAGQNFWLKTPDLGRAPVRSKPFLVSSTKLVSSWPASSRSLSRRQSLLSLSTSAPETSAVSALFLHVLIWEVFAYISFSRISWKYYILFVFSECSIRTICFICFHWSSSW